MKLPKYSRWEHESLKVIPGRMLVKHRYHDEFKGRKFAVDFFLDGLSNLAMCEVECESESSLMSVEWPEYAVAEATTSPFFTGGSLCKTDFNSLNENLAKALNLGGVT